MFRPVFFLACLFPFLLSAQIKADKAVFDHGDIRLFNNDTAWFTLNNSSSKTAFLLPTMPKDDYAVLTDGQSIAPGGSMRIGIVYYTGEKGRFEQKVPLYFSNANEPLILYIKGNIRSIHETAFSTCPSIENSRPLKPEQIPLQITVRDMSNSEILSSVKLEVVNRRVAYNCVPGYESRTYKCKLPYGLLAISAEKTGYESSQLSFEYSENNYQCVVFLKRNIRSDSMVRKEPVYTLKQETRDTAFREDIPLYVPVAYADSGFNSYRYKPNHLIFIVDISGSMKDSGKLNFLKRSMRELTAMIRPGDYITLITYTNKVRVVFEHKSGLETSAINTAIDTLKAGGGSNGSQSLVLAYELARKHFINGGNNQVFIATDGLLNSSKMSNEDLYRLAAKAYRQDHVILSAIGFGDDAAAIAFLQKLARSGRGNFLRIRNLEADLRALAEEVKIQSRI